jgi:hypothetical protein
MSRTVIIRHGAPSKYDHAPFGAACKLINQSRDGFELFIQYSKDETNPIWESLGHFYGEIDDHLCDALEKNIKIKFLR